MTYLGFQAGGGQRGPDRHAFGQSPESWILVDRPVDVGNSGLVETITLDVLDYANHCAPRRVGCAPRAPHAQTAADRIAVRPVGTCCAFIDDGHRLLAGIIGFREITSAYERGL